MRRFSLFLFYLLILFIPSQLARHFFFDFSAVSGLRSDYLAPTVYFTDIVAVLLIISVIPNLFRNSVKTLKSPRAILLLFFCYLLFNVLFIAANKWAAFYKLVKIIEFVLLGVAISKLRPKLSTVIFVLSAGVFYSSVIAVWQFLAQKSVGGIFWFLGERTFYSSTPGIAAFSYKGGFLLRPYATFAHPNVLGGFLAVTLPLVLFSLVSNWQKFGRLLKSYFWVVLGLGLTGLAISFSRAAWFSASLGFAWILLDKKIHLHKKILSAKKPFLTVFCLVTILSVASALVLPQTFLSRNQYWRERADLIKTAIPMTLANLPFGVGLNNFIVQAQNYANGFPGLYIFQPVHNIYLLVLSETGLLGFFFFFWGVLVIIGKAFKSKSVLLVPLTQLLVLGFFDHYLFTLQQGQLMLVLFAALIFVPKMAY